MGPRIFANHWGQPLPHSPDFLISTLEGRSSTWNKEGQLLKDQEQKRQLRRGNNPLNLVAHGVYRCEGSSHPGTSTVHRVRGWDFSGLAPAGFAEQGTNPGLLFQKGQLIGAHSSPPDCSLTPSAPAGPLPHGIGQLHELNVHRWAFGEVGEALGFGDIVLHLLQVRGQHRGLRPVFQRHGHGHSSGS